MLSPQVINGENVAQCSRPNKKWNPRRSFGFPYALPRHRPIRHRKESSIVGFHLEPFFRGTPPTHHIHPMAFSRTQIYWFELPVLRKTSEIKYTRDGLILIVKMFIPRYTKEFRVSFLEPASPTPNVSPELSLRTISHFEVHMLSKVPLFLSYMFPKTNHMRPNNLSSGPSSMRATILRANKLLPIHVLLLPKSP